MLSGTYSETLRLALGVLALMGFAVAVINGMLHKILPEARARQQYMAYLAEEKSVCCRANSSLHCNPCHDAGISLTLQL